MQRIIYRFKKNEKEKELRAKKLFNYIANVEYSIGT